MGSRTKKTKGTSSPVFDKTWFPGQESYIPEFIKQWKNIYAGNMDDPMAKMLQQNVGEAAMKETSEETKNLGGMRGVSAPAKAKIAGNLGEKKVAAMAKVPGDVWAVAKDIITQYTLTPPTVASGTTSRTSGGGGWGVCCFIFCAADPDDNLLRMVRRFKDTYYSKLSPIAQGYKRLAIWIVPLMRRYPLVKKVVKALMVHPMSLYAKAFYEEDHLIQALLYPIARFWVSTYWVVGKVYGEKVWRRYFNLIERW